MCIRDRFEVAKDAGKIEIKKAIEEIFDVKVIKVTTTTIHAKEKRVGANPSGMTATRKKAVVKLSADSKNIEIFEGCLLYTSGDQLRNLPLHRRMHLFPHRRSLRIAKTLSDVKRVFH